MAKRPQHYNKQYTLQRWPVGIASLILICFLLIPRMAFILSDVDVADAESIARNVQEPAMRNGPLYRTMFPSESITPVQREEVICWYAEMLDEAFRDRKESFLKTCSVEGTPVGFCGWTVIERDPQRQARVADDTANRQPKEQQARKARSMPQILDIDGWTTISEALRTERNRVLDNLDDICRKLRKQQ
jgi:hypothetical protein